MYSYGSPQKQDDQLERTFSSYVRIQDVVLKTYLGRWTIGRSGERGSGISVLPARYDDDDICIYIMCVYCHPQTDCFVLSELFSVARHVERWKPGSKPIQLYVRLSLRPLGQQAYHVWLRELLRHLCSNSSVRLFTFFNTLSATRVLNSFEELCIMRAAAENSFTRVLNSHGGAYILSSTDRLRRK